MNGPTTQTSSSLPPPLRTVADMPADWRDVELPFDEAADRIIRAHQLDGEAHDLPIV